VTTLLLRPQTLGASLRTQQYHSYGIHLACLTARRTLTGYTSTTTPLLASTLSQQTLVCSQKPNRLLAHVSETSISCRFA
jgi:hypothetical protein